MKCAIKEYEIIISFSYFELIIFFDKSSYMIKCIFRKEVTRN